MSFEEIYEKVEEARPTQADYERFQQEYKTFLDGSGLDGDINNVADEVFYEIWPVSEEEEGKAVDFLQRLASKYKMRYSHYGTKGDGQFHNHYVAWDLQWMV